MCLSSDHEILSRDRAASSASSEGDGNTFGNFGEITPGLLDDSIMEFVNSLPESTGTYNNKAMILVCCYYYYYFA